MLISQSFPTMNTLTRRFFLPVLAATLLLGTVGARAAAGGIQDDGAFFSEFAKVNATGTISDVATRLHKDIAVQTFAVVPDDMKSVVLQSDKAATNRGFSQWAEQLARSKKVNGVFIMLVKQPAHLQVVVGTDTQRQAFTLADRTALVQRMLEQLRHQKNDDALIDAVNFISSTMTSHRNGGASPISSKAHATRQGGSSWLPTIVIVVLIWVGFSLIRGLFRSMSGGGGVGGVGQPYGGGGFFQNMMGSMFGAAAGMWMYDQFFGSHSSAAFGSEHSDAMNNDAGFSGTDSDYTSSGGSFGDDSGGSFGGGDSGGGDFGGGGDF
ncbi:MAG: hypothetical protein B7Z37_06485 [Verrucomicrobia bacterium 12-59-8]|nr:MAG: hypothetical protein B7Z37_06485 [Verrucomicrobia bacterium 12-59-8]